MLHAQRDVVDMKTYICVRYMKSQHEVNIFKTKRSPLVSAQIVAKLSFEFAQSELLSTVLKKEPSRAEDEEFSFPYEVNAGD